MESTRITYLSRFIATLALLWTLTPGSVGAQEWVYTVVDGDTLWDLSEKYLYKVGYWKGLQRINNVKNPRKMQPGTRLRVPLKWIRVNAASARLSALNGRAMLIRADGTRISEPAPGEQIRLGDRLETGPKASAAVILADGSVITLHEQTQLRFDHLSAYGDTGMVDTRANLSKGRADSRVRPAAGPGSRFEISTPSAISAVRGTDYRTTVVEERAASNVEVLGGAVLVKGASSKRLVKAGFGTQVAAEQPPLPPRKLLDPPVFDPMPDKIRTLNWPITWQAAEGAHGYRAEIAATGDFEILLWERSLVSPRLPFPDLPDGSYHVRVRGVDEIGLEGIDASMKVELDARPQPPLPLQPHQDQVFRGDFPTLSWTASSEAEAYRVQVAADQAFEEILVDAQDLQSLEFDPRGLPGPGRYYWRLISISATGEQGPPGAVRSWQVKPIPDRPEVQLEATEERVLVSWREGAPDQSYQVQLALDDEFQDLSIDRKMTQTQMELEPVKGQVRYLRVRIIEPDGYLGPWGATQKLDPAPDDSWMLMLIAAILGILLI